MKTFPEALSFFSYRTPFGRITIQSDGESIRRLVLGEESLEGIFSPDSLMNDAATQVNEYLVGKRTIFDIPLAPRGSEFQISVWNAAKDIPYGQTRTPSEIAEIIGMPDSFRAVGKAANENPIAIIVPAHRITKAGIKTISPKDRNSFLRAKFRELERRFS